VLVVGDVMGRGVQAAGLRSAQTVGDVVASTARLVGRQHDARFAVSRLGLDRLAHRRVGTQFGDRDSGAYLAKFAWTKIVRHTLVKGRSSPDDPALVQYWVDRRRKGPPLPMGRASLHLLFVQHGRCPVCQGLLLHADRPPQSPQEWEQWLAATRKAIAMSYLTVREDGRPDENKLRLVHAQCQRRHVSDDTGTALLPASEPSGLA